MSVASQIKEGRKAASLSQQQLADFVGVSRTAIIQWEKEGKTPKLRAHHIQLLSKALNKPPSAFQRFGGDTVSPAMAEGRHAIFLLNWSELKHLSLGGKVLKEALKKPHFIEVAKEISKKAVAFVIQDDSMVNKRGEGFQKGEEVIIDPEMRPTSDKDFVLVRLKSGEHLFRRYRPRDGAYDLVAENTDWDTVSVSSRAPAEILGVLVEHRKRYRR